MNAADLNALAKYHERLALELDSSAASTTQEMLRLSLEMKAAKHRRWSNDLLGLSNSNVSQLAEPCLQQKKN